MNAITQYIITSIIGIPSTVLYLRILYVIWRNRRLTSYASFFYRIIFSQAVLDLFWVPFFIFNANSLTWPFAYPFLLWTNVNTQFAFLTGTFYPPFTYIYVFYILYGQCYGIVLISLHRLLSVMTPQSNAIRFLDSLPRLLIMIVHWASPLVNSVIATSTTIAVTIFGFICYSVMFLKLRRMTTRDSSRIRRRELPLIVSSFALFLFMCLMTTYFVLLYLISSVGSLANVMELRTFYPVLSSLFCYSTPWLLLVTSAETRKRVLGSRLDSIFSSLLVFRFARSSIVAQTQLTQATRMNKLTSYILISIIGLPSTVLYLRVLYVIWTNRRLPLFSSFYYRIIFSQACFDLFFVPFFILSSNSLNWPFAYSFLLWTNGTFYPPFAYIFVAYILYGQCYGIALISLLRLISVVTPHARAIQAGTSVHFFFQTPTRFIYQNATNTLQMFTNPADINVNSIIVTATTVSVTIFGVICYSVLFVKLRRMNSRDSSRIRRRELPLIVSSFALFLFMCLETAYFVVLHGVTSVGTFVDALELRTFYPLIAALFCNSTPWLLLVTSAETRKRVLGSRLDSMLSCRIGFRLSPSSLAAQTQPTNATNEQRMTSLTR